MFCRRALVALIFLFSAVKMGWAAAGTEGASFLDIPVGGGPAALGSAYTAQANDVYAPIWNPAGLGFLHGVEFSGMHLSYLGPVHYEHAGLVIPLGEDKEADSAPAGFGASVQYLGTGSIDERDDTGTSVGTFTSSFAAYTLAYGQRVLEKLSLGTSVKLITEKISDASASAYAADLGLLYKPTARFSLGAALANAGTQIKFVDEADPLPLAGRLGMMYQLDPQWDLSAEGVYRRNGLASGSMGLEWRCAEYITLRAGYNTSHIKELGGGSGITAGLGVFFWGQEFSYAYVPVGDLGQTHYFSIVFRTSVAARPDRPRLKKSSDDEDFEDLKKDNDTYHDIFDFMKDDEQKPID